MNLYNTDKYSHGFIDVYEPYFNQMKDVKNVLEIGVYNGDSLNYFSNYFKDADIYGIDIIDKTQYDSDKIKTFMLNQENRGDISTFLSKNNIEYDIILDDGGHTMRQQQISFGMFFKNVKSGGLYILEDLHTSRLDNFGTIFKTDLITSLDMLYNLKYTNNLVSNHITDDEKRYIEENVESIFIWSVNAQYNQSVTAIIKKK
jgi:hypothetical protein